MCTTHKKIIVNILCNYLLQQKYFLWVLMGNKSKCEFKQHLIMYLSLFRHCTYCPVENPVFVHNCPTCLYVSELHEQGGHHGVRHTPPVGSRSKSMTPCCISVTSPHHNQHNWHRQGSRLHFYTQSVRTVTFAVGKSHRMTATHLVMKYSPGCRTGRRVTTTLAMF